jgi:hypothetical protein
MITNEPKSAHSRNRERNTEGPLCDSPQAWRSTLPVVKDQEEHDEDNLVEEFAQALHKESHLTFRPR